MTFVTDRSTAEKRVCEETYHRSIVLPVRYCCLVPTHTTGPPLGRLFRCNERRASGRIVAGTASSAVGSPRRGRWPDPWREHWSRDVASSHRPELRPGRHTRRVTLVGGGLRDPGNVEAVTRWTTRSCPSVTAVAAVVRGSRQFVSVSPPTDRSTPPGPAGSESTVGGSGPPTQIRSDPVRPRRNARLHRCGPYRTPVRWDRTRSNARETTNSRPSGDDVFGRGSRWCASTPTSVARRR